VHGLPGFVDDNGSPLAVSSQPRVDSKHQRAASMVQREDVLDDDFERRTIRDRYELQVFPNLGKPESFHDNASRLQEKVNRLRKLHEQEFNRDGSVVVAQFFFA